VCSLLDFGGPTRRSIFVFLLRVAAVPVGPRLHVAMGALEVPVAMRVSLDLELMTLCVAWIVSSEAVSLGDTALFLFLFFHLARQFHSEAVRVQLLALGGRDRRLRTSLRTRTLIRQDRTTRASGTSRVYASITQLGQARGRFEHAKIHPNNARVVDHAVSYASTSSQVARITSLIASSCWPVSDAPNEWLCTERGGDRAPAQSETHQTSGLRARLHSPPAQTHRQRGLSNAARGQCSICSFTDLRMSPLDNFRTYTLAHAKKVFRSATGSRSS
jgi:hypothetical protein